ncbi:MFS transporter [Ponticaulis sp.]|uniref:MFS transporter n=1 Tax=Ponticaulis sp. TaxID=2020902 RepID=UPI000C55FEBB|nr:MFS transporter [Ponticaulis sp.]MBN05777.1 MFS transporter [Ponticaulis sp.]
MSEAAPVRPLSRLQKWVIAFGLLSMGVGFTISFVVAPPLARSAGLTELQVAGMLTLSSLLFAFMTPVWGRISGRIGRKRVMVFALFMTAFNNMIFLFTLDAAIHGVFVGLQAFFALAAVRTAFGLLSSGLQPAAFAAMTDATTPHDRAAGLGFLGAAMSVGSILGPAAAAVLARFGALAPLWGSVAFSLMCSVIFLFVLPKEESDSTRQRPKPLSLMDPRVRPFIIFLISYFMAVACVQQTIAWFVSDRFGFQGAEAVEFGGLVFAVMAVCMVLVQTFYVDRFKPDPRFMLPVGLALVATGYATAIIHTPFIFLCMSFAVMGSGAALIVPSLNALGTLAVEPKDQGAAGALMAAAPPAGFVVGPLIGAGLYMIHNDLPLTVSATAMVCLLIAALVFVKRPKTVRQ